MSETPAQYTTEREEMEQYQNDCILADARQILIDRMKSDPLALTSFVIDIALTAGGATNIKQQGETQNGNDQPQ